MSQSGFTPISIYYSTTASAVPTAANLVPGELAINTADGKLYYEDSSGVVQVLATKSTGSIGGSNTQVQFNNSGSLGGSSGLTWDGSFLTTSSIKNSALTSGRVTYAGASGLLSDSANFTYNGTALTLSASSAISAIFNRNTSSGATVQIQVVGGSVGTLGSDTGGNGVFDIAATSSMYLRATGASSIMAFSTNNAEVMRILANGSVGIGTSSPSYTLDLSSTTNGIIARFKSTSTYGQVVADNSSGTGGGLFVTKQNGTNTAIFGNSGGILGNTSTDVGIYGAVAGSSINFYNDDTPILKMTLNSSGNLGLGVAPSASDSVFKVLDVGQAGNGISGNSGTTQLTQGVYYNSGYKYSVSSTAVGRYEINTGVHKWNIAQSGTAGNAISFTQAMTLDASGNLLVGTTSVISSGKQTISYSGLTNNGLIISESADTSGTTFLGFNIGATNIGNVSRVGATSAVIYNTTSDQRLKSNIADASPVLDKLMDVKVRQFDWTVGDLHQEAGFIAQELEPVLSGIVTKGKTEEDMWQMDYSRLTPYLVKAIQEQQALIESLTTRLIALESK